MEKTEIALPPLFVSSHTVPLRLAQEESMAKSTTQDVLLEAHMRFAVFAWETGEQENIVSAFIMLGPLFFT